MKTLQILENNINERHISEVVNVLRDGGIIIYPTDTLYALGCDALSNSAIERVCALKNKEMARATLSIVCSDISEVAKYAKLSNDHFRLMRKNVPGPFTFILPALNKLPKVFKGRKVVGVRIPDNTIARRIVEALGHPILSTTVEGIDDDYLCEPGLIMETYEHTEVECIIDSGRSEISASTIVDLTEDEPEITRQGKGELEWI